MPTRSSNAPVLTIFAGPNGSGKSTIVEEILKTSTLGVLVNADQIAASLAIRKGETTASPTTQMEAAIAAEEMRWALLEQGATFATETVMSDASRWLRFFRAAKENGYRVVLYFITTADPQINVSRVAERVLAGGHAVDESKIISRYHKVMNEVLPAILSLVDEAILFDNSSVEGAIGVLTIQAGHLTVLVDASDLPHWTKDIVMMYLN